MSEPTPHEQKMETNQSLLRSSRLNLYKGCKTLYIGMDGDQQLQNTVSIWVSYDGRETYLSNRDPG